MSAAPEAELSARAAALAARTPGPAAGILGRWLPPEIPAALGFRPAFPAAAVGPGAARAGLELAGADSCPLCRALAGAAAEGAAPVADLEILAGGSGCDQQRRALEALGRVGRVPVVAFAAPRTWSDNALRRYRDQLAALAGRMGELAGRTLDAPGLAGSIAGYRKLRRELRELRPRLGFAPFARLVVDCLSAGPGPALELLASARLPERPGPRVRLLLAGSCLDLASAGFLAECVDPAESDAVEDLLPAVGGLLEPEVPEGEEHLDGLARAWFGQADPGRRPNDRFYRRLTGLAAACRADAVILRCLRFCDSCAAERVRLARALAPLPMLFLDEEPGAEAASRRRTRIGALLEELSCRRA